MKLYLFVANGSELCEALLSVDLFKRAGIKTEIISIENDIIIEASNGVKFIADMNINEGTYFDADAIVLPGGLPGVDNLYANKELLNIINEYNNSGKIIGAICAAPSILGKEGILDNKDFTCYPGFEGYSENGNYTANKVEVVENIITGKGLGATFEFAGTIIEKLLGSEAKNKVFEQIMYK